MSHKDFYEVLSLKRNCTNEDIANSYRRLALKFNPKRNNPQEYAMNNFNFHKVAEAYLILSDPTNRGTFDIYGEEGLRNGIRDDHGNTKGGFKYDGSADKLFEQFFGRTNPFQLIKDFDRNDDEYGTIFGSAFKGQYDPKVVVLENINTFLACTLEELYIGAVKKLSYKKQTINMDGRTTEIKLVTIDIEIMKGYSKETVLTFKDKGNESPETKNSDLIVQITEIPNQNFKRIDSDLIYVQRLSLQDALNAEPVIIITLDKRTLNIAMDELITPQTVKVIRNEGMPIYNANKKILEEIQKGHLLIHFDIIFPRFIEPENKEEIIKLLDKNSS